VDLTLLGFDGLHQTDFALAHLNLSSVVVGNAQLTDDTVTGTVSASDANMIQVESCQFLHSASATGGMLELSGANSAVVSNNTFTSAAVDDTAVAIDSSFNVTVSYNTIKLTGGGSFAAGILVQNSFADTGVDLDTNVIQTSTKAGIGVLTSKASGTATGNTLNLRLEGNDLRKNFVGLAVIGDGTYLGNIDAGRANGSPGGNNFQGFTPNPDGRAAIETLFATTGTAQAHFNTWSVLSPQTVVAPATGTTIATGSSLALLGPGVLDLFLDQSAIRLDMRDNGLGGIGVAFDRGAEQTFSGIRQITVESGGGHRIEYALLPADRPGELLPSVRPADLLVHLGLEDSFTLSAALGAAAPARPWTIDVDGRGDDQVRARIGPVPVRLAVQFGAGNNLADLSFSGIAHLSSPDTVDVRGGRGNTDVRVSFAFRATPAMPRTEEAPVTVTVTGGAGHNHIQVTYAVQGPFSTFAVPLHTTLKSGPGGNEIHVSYTADPALGSAPIVFAAPVVLDIIGGRRNVIDVTFGPGAASPGMPAPPPVLNSLFRMRLQGGPENDTIAADLIFAAGSRGRVELLLGGLGEDDLTLVVHPSVRRPARAAGPG
jgi:hypothetical protein